MKDNDKIKTKGLHKDQPPLLAISNPASMRVQKFSDVT